MSLWAKLAWWIILVTLSWIVVLGLLYTTYNFVSYLFMVLFP